MLVDIVWLQIDRATSNIEIVILYRDIISSDHGDSVSAYVVEFVISDSDILNTTESRRIRTRYIYVDTIASILGSIVQNIPENTILDYDIVRLTNCETMRIFVVCIQNIVKF